ncbi:dihydroneopterin aldolase [Flavobacteriaceae bacterium UJ101]|nr:dihydroneopterin aldolase [Flavobacteriaceae bacterium UJ101]
MGKLHLQNIKIFAYHGCMQVEEMIGSFYEVNLIVKADLSKVSNTDNIKDTVNYVELNKIIHEQMAIVSKTIEHVGNRILNEIGKVLSDVKWAEISISKINPPVEGDMEKFTVILERAYKS